MKCFFLNSEKMDVVVTPLLHRARENSPRASARLRSLQPSGPCLAGRTRAGVEILRCCAPWWPDSVIALQGSQPGKVLLTCSPVAGPAGTTLPSTAWKEVDSSWGKPERLKVEKTFIDLLNKHLLSTYYMPGSVLGSQIQC